MPRCANLAGHRPGIVTEFRAYGKSRTALRTVALVSPLRVALLGAPRVEYGGQPVGFDTRKATALLAYLAVTGHPHGRDTLGALLWPEQDAAQARGALRRTMSVLNAGTGGHTLTADRSSVALRPQAQAWLDVAEFSALAACGTHGHERGTSCARCVADLTAAAALYRDDFLAGFAVRDCPDFDDWQGYQAQGLRQQLARVLERLAAALVTAGAVDAAVEPARRWLALDPLHEPAHAVLMRLYAQTDQRSAAMRQYRECVGVLHRELGVPPLASTTDLDAAIRAGRLSPVLVEPAPAVPAVAAEPASAVPLVGRARELALLTEAARSSTAHGRLVVLTGEAGVGKTRLLTALSRSTGGCAVGARCHEGEEGVAFGVITDLLRAVMAREPAAFGRLPPPWQAEVGRLVPEAAGGDVPEPPPLDSPGAQGRFCAALVAALAAGVGAGSQRAVLTVEDLQWSDASSVGVLAYLVRRLRDVPIVVVLTWRPEAAGSARSLATAVAAAARDGVASLVELQRLDHAAVAELAEAVLPAPLAPPVVTRLWEETGGLPLFVTEYLDAFCAGGAVPADGQWQLPGGVRDLLEGRLVRLSEMTLQVLAAAAVLNPDVRPRLLRTTSGRGEEEVVAALEEAATAGILVEGNRPGATYEFGQEALRRLVYEGTSLARRRLLHSRAADALAGERGPQDLAAAVAAHLRLAGRDADSAEWSWRAAQRALRLYAQSEALEHLNAAAALGHPGRLVQRAIGDVLTVLGRYREALLAYDRAVAACTPGDEVTSAVLEHRLAEVHHRMGAWDLADSHLSTALELLSVVDQPSLRARVLADSALVAYRQGAAGGAARAAAEALDAATAAQDDAALAQVHNVLGVLASERADLVAAERHLRQSLRHARRLPDLGARVAALNNLALLHSAAEQPAEALAVAREALELGLAHGDRHRAAALHTNLADLLHAAGERAEAREHLTAAARLFAEVDDEQLRRPEIWKLTRW